MIHLCDKMTDACSCLGHILILIEVDFFLLKNSGNKDKHYGEGLTCASEINTNTPRQLSNSKEAIKIDSRFKEAHCNLAVAYIELRNA